MRNTASHMLTELTAHNNGRVFRNSEFGDEAFPLKKNLMRLYSEVSLTNVKRKVYNYRPSWMVSDENVFGILVAQWRVFQWVINAQPENLNFVKSSCIFAQLYNLLISETDSVENMYCPPTFVDREINGELQEGDWRSNIPDIRLHFSTFIQNHIRLGARNATSETLQFHEDLADYFFSPCKCY